jgi:hypothetical protein
MGTVFSTKPSYLKDVNDIISDFVFCTLTSGTWTGSNSICLLQVRERFMPSNRLDYAGKILKRHKGFLFLGLLWPEMMSYDFCTHSAQIKSFVQLKSLLSSELQRCKPEW